MKCQLDNAGIFFKQNCQFFMDGTFSERLGNIEI
jgi:hypothetical protein